MQIKSLVGIGGRWKLDEASGTVASDASGIGNNGTHTNGPVVNQAGADGAAVSFDGIDDYVAIPDATSLKATDSITLAVWVHPTPSTNVDRMIVNKEGEYELALSDTNAIKWAIANTSPRLGLASDDGRSPKRYVVAHRSGIRRGASSNLP